MATELKKFTEAYATLTVAVYEPLILKWISGNTLGTLADIISLRAQKAKNIRLKDALSTIHAISSSRAVFKFNKPKMENPGSREDGNTGAIDLAGHQFSEDAIQKINLKGFPDAVRVANKIFPGGILNVQLRNQALKGNAELGVRTLPTFFNRRMGSVDPDFDFAKARVKTFQLLHTAARNAITNQGSMSTAVADALKGAGLYEFFPGRRIEEALSPIGIAHFYRQLYFNAEEGYGPIEEAFTIAPLETLEVLVQSVRRQIHEEVLEIGSETVSENAVETKNLEEISDKVSSMMQRDSSAAMSVNASYSAAVWQAGASASANFSTSSQRGKEEASRRLKEVTKRASERITKTFSLKTRDVLDVTTTNMMRRVIKNESATPVSYGLRRVLRRVRVKVQDLGPSLVWQLYIRNPGAGLAKGRFVHFREGEDIAVPEVPPGMPPRPKGGIDTGSTCADLQGTSERFVTLVIQPGPDRVVTAVSIDSITDLEGGGKEDEAPVPMNDLQSLPAGQSKYWDETTHTYTVNIRVLPGDSRSVSLTYTYVWEPAQHVLDEWEAERKTKVQELTQQALNEKFERDKALITEKSKIKTRPPADLRREERYEVMNRMISHLFARADDPAEPTPLEIEYFNRYFDIEAMFVYVHPSWWKPRYTKGGTGLDRPAYEITSESEPAPMGSSLGWLLQIDGDTRRNEFLNSPWVRTCLPIRPGREREAIIWLSKHIEGEVGYNINAAPLKTLLEGMEKIRENQIQLGIEGPDYITIETKPGTGAEPEGPLKPEHVYPVIQEFEVTVPTDGFVYDELKLT